MKYYIAIFGIWIRVPKYIFYKAEGKLWRMTTL